MFKRRTDKVIEDLTAATCGLQSDQRQMYVLAQALQALVLLAKAEQLLEMRMDAERASGSLAGASHKRQTRAILRKIGMDVKSRQRELEFGHPFPKGKDKSA